LIQQRLEDVMVCPIDHRYVGVRVAELLRGGKPSKSASDDHDLLSAH
jgi:hypothetical protein